MLIWQGEKWFTSTDPLETVSFRNRGWEVFLLNGSFILCSKWPFVSCFPSFGFLSLDVHGSGKLDFCPVSQVRNGDFFFFFLLVMFCPVLEWHMATNINYTWLRIHNSTWILIPLKWKLWNYWWHTLDSHLNHAFVGICTLRHLRNESPEVSL